MTPEQLASLAASLNDNEAFQAALNRQRTNALDDLASMKHEDAEAFYAAQATVRCIDTIRADLRLFLSATAVKKPGLP